MLLAIILVLLIVGSVLFHFLTPWWFTEIASNWGTIDDTVSLTFWVTGTVFVVVNLFLAYVVFRFRAKPGHTAHYEPENKKLEWWLTGITTVGVAAMLAPGLFVWAKFIDVPDDAAHVEAVGQQWDWSFRFPGKDGELGTVDATHISMENPFGMNPDDPNGLDDVLVGNSVVHLPLNKPVKMLLRSKDVLHDFAVAQFRVKMDLVPGLVSYVWFTPTRTGTFDILCEELCGVGHHTMRGRVVVEVEKDYLAWLDSQPTYAQTQTQTRVVGNAATGKEQFALCGSCHGPQAEGNAALNAPKLAGQPDWYLKRQLAHYKQGVRGTHEQDVYGKMMAPMAAMLADDAAINNVVAYIQTLPNNPAAHTVSGDVHHGKKLYATCSACHGPAGQGRWSTNAPRTAGMSDWYMVTQLRNFRHGIRGAHRQDAYGKQMAAMIGNLNNDQAINDLVAYINTLPAQP